MRQSDVVNSGHVVEMIWDDISQADCKFQNPDWIEIEQQINKLSTPERSMVILKTFEDTSLTIAGDIEHGFLVFLTKKDKFQYVMSDPENHLGKRQITLGFQPGEYANKILVDKLRAMTVTRFFFDTGLASNEFQWTEDDTPDKGNAT